MNDLADILESFAEFDWLVSSDGYNKAKYKYNPTEDLEW
eukprot:CAMPEP_0116899802 /NCGR_PEP_ID=MMETSP0467-20121206/8297_1 /TAXON_ID=283647 /ORGANISM="Mesodinium pulex, Strain SPMC105" /LENGTH=38 /DNA_ID= /DNA_START= /DNA_END= /DNA_ORIENTATION=